MLPRMATLLTIIFMDEQKKRTQEAINSWYKKQDTTTLKTRARKKKTNDNPEGRFVLVLKKHLESLGFSIDIVEAKAVYNESAGRYMNGKARPGFPDMVGNTPNGLSVWIEVKAPGKRKTIRPEQHAFLLNKIDMGCFAICCDSIEYVDKILMEWKKSENRKKVLLESLPPLQKRYQGDDLSDLFLD